MCVFASPGLKVQCYKINLIVLKWVLPIICHIIAVEALSSLKYSTLSFISDKISIFWDQIYIIGLPFARWQKSVFIIKKINFKGLFNKASSSSNFAQNF